MPKPRTMLEIVLAVALAGALAFIFLRPEPEPLVSMPFVGTVRFMVGGSAADAANSENVAWGQPVQIMFGSMWVEAAGDEAVTCRILKGEVAVSEAHAAGKGNRATCAFGG